ncbi:TetR/AcrR family transcriptional regulator [Streptomyces sp. SID5785]|uniref:TetR/AcrR family transcriptional regulator n=1 Tax=Streptomyces sp. SID5785 TaxID=2690309 RepID=UPI0013614D67|nr:TetR/AcrR family transcriptional regulator C-terminal domain-containing protein [Streptomyces sp. SID5785]MZD10097.1 TetR/AcrR family transcriptional regulator [Streptomyces sp. SID5785]
MTCEECGRPVHAKGRGRPPRYCSTACRSRAYRARHDARGAGLSGTDAHAPRQSAPQAGDPHRSGPAEGSLTAQRIVEAAIRIADSEGLEALSMRRTAADLGVGVMSQYRHIPDKETLIDLTVETLFAAHPLPARGAHDWRAALELSARSEWEIYRAHPWLALIVAGTTRPPLAPSMMAYTDWRMRTVGEHGLTLPAMLQVAVAVSTAVQGSALALARAGSAAEDEAWLASRQSAISAVFAHRELPLISRFGAAEFRAVSPENVFEFTLRCTLDGIEVLLSGQREK